MRQSCRARLEQEDERHRRVGLSSRNRSLVIGDSFAQRIDSRSPDLAAIERQDDSVRSTLRTQLPHGRCDMEPHSAFADTHPLGNHLVIAANSQESQRAALLRAENARIQIGQGGQCNSG